MKRLAELLPRMDYDLCVLTGDYRGATYGAFDAALEGLARVRAHLKGQIYGVLGNHDTIRLVPELEGMGIRMLLNECEVISRDNQRIYLAGIDDAHYYRVVILKRRPQKSLMAGFRSSCHTRRKFIARRPAPVRSHPWRPDMSARLNSDHSGFRSTQAYGSGCWKYHNMLGYTSVGGRILHCRGSPKLPSGNHASPPSTCLTPNMARRELNSRRESATLPKKIRTTEMMSIRLKQSAPRRASRGRSDSGI